MKLGKKFIAAVISALTGLILLPMLAIEVAAIKYIPILIIYFLPAFSIALVIFFELITKIEKLEPVYRFIQTRKIIVLFVVLLGLEWIIMWQVDPMNDMVWTAQFATAILSAIFLYNWLTKKWNLYSMRGGAQI